MLLNKRNTQEVKSRANKPQMSIVNVELFNSDKKELIERILRQ